MLFVGSIIFKPPVQYGSYEYPHWAWVLGWCITGSSIICIPIYAVYKLLITPGNLCERLRRVWQPEELPCLAEVNEESVLLSLPYERTCVEQENANASANANATSNANANGKREAARALAMKNNHDAHANVANAVNAANDAQIAVAPATTFVNAGAREQVRLSIDAQQVLLTNESCSS